MKKKLTLSLIATSMIAFLLTGCQKNAKDPYEMGDADAYRVEKMIVPADMLVASNRRILPIRNTTQHIPYATQPAPHVTAGTSDTLTFTYNSMDNPVRIVHSMGIGENVLFKYDKWNRLSEYINIYPNGAGDYWHRYAYDKMNSDRIIADTAFRDFFSVNGTMVSYNDIDLMVFKYDTQDRISQSAEYVLGDTIVTNYTYDGRGDLQNGSIYDNKLNNHLTNKIWMFIDRDYSLNNPVNNGVYIYNKAGLPVTINTNPQSAAGFEFIVIGYPFAISKVSIIYSTR
ncbi:MAG TPA: hypothetical protein VNS58_31530 [Puia sp.]|nr:hypothetical protein [Puia sp.]